MPEMDGFAASAAIRARETGAEHCVIIAVAALAIVGDDARCRTAGMDGYLSKPYQRDELVSLLRRWLAPVPALQSATALVD